MNTYDRLPLGSDFLIIQKPISIVRACKYSDTYRFLMGLLYNDLHRKFPSDREKLSHFSWVCNLINSVPQWKVNLERNVHKITINWLDIIRLLYNSSLHHPIKKEQKRKIRFNIFLSPWNDKFFTWILAMRNWHFLAEWSHYDFQWEMQ